MSDYLGNALIERALRMAGVRGPAGGGRPVEDGQGGGPPRESYGPPAPIEAVPVEAPKKFYYVYDNEGVKRQANESDWDSAPYDPWTDRDVYPWPDKTSSFEPSPGAVTDVMRALPEGVRPYAAMPAIVAGIPEMIVGATKSKLNQIFPEPEKRPPTGRPELDAQIADLQASYGWPRAIAKTIAAPLVAPYALGEGLYHVGKDAWGKLSDDLEGKAPLNKQEMAGRVFDLTSIVPFATAATGAAGLAASSPREAATAALAMAAEYARRKDGSGRQAGQDQALAGAGAEAAGLPGPGELRGRGDELSPPDRAGDPYARIPGIPETVKIPGRGNVEARPVPWLVDAANSYARKAGIEHSIPQAFGPINTERAARIARAFDAMEHNPADPKVVKSYDALAGETLDQFRALREAGFEPRFNKPGEDPYTASPALGYPEMRDQRSLSIFPTSEGYGSAGVSALDIENNPMLKKSGERIGGEDALYNDLFRGVHDAFGHYTYGNPFFRAPGEERAWMLHSGMYSPEARPAMTTELRGQNNWLNFGPHAEHNKTASAAETIYAPQKIGLLPDFAVEEGRHGISLPEFLARKKDGTIFSNPDEAMLPGLAVASRPGSTLGPESALRIASDRKLNHGLYSVLDENIASTPMKAGTAQQWINASKKGGEAAKDSEIKWRGLDKFLLSRKPNEKFTKEEIQAHLGANKVKLREHIHNDEGYTADELRNSELESISDRDLDHDYKIKLDEDMIENRKDAFKIEADPDNLGTFRLVDKDSDVVEDGFANEADALASAYERAEEIVRDSNEGYALYDSSGSEKLDGGFRSERKAEERAKELAGEVEARRIEDMSDRELFEDSGQDKREETSGYLDDRPKGGERYSEQVFSVDKNTLDRGGSKGRSAVEGGDVHPDSIYENPIGWLLREQYDDALGRGSGTAVHEIQSRWGQAGSDKGWAKQASVEEMASAAEKTQAADAAWHSLRNKYADAASGVYRIKDELLGDGMDAQYTASKVKDATENYLSMRYNHARDADGTMRDIEHLKQQIKAAEEGAARINKASGDPASAELLKQYTQQHQRAIPRLVEAEQALANLNDSARIVDENFHKIYGPYVEKIDTSNPVLLPEYQAYQNWNSENQAARLRYMEARDAERSLGQGVEPGPFVEDSSGMPFLLKTGLYDSAKRGDDFFAVSGPERIAERWSGTGADEIYAKAVPNILQKLAKAHDKNAKLEDFYPGEAPAPVGKYEEFPLRRGGVDYGAVQSALPFNEPFMGAVMSARSSQPVTGIVMGKNSNGDPVYHLSTAIGIDTASPAQLRNSSFVSKGWAGQAYGADKAAAFKSRPAAEKAMAEINAGIEAKNAEYAANPDAILEDWKEGQSFEEGYKGLRLTPELRESIVKRGFPMFVNPKEAASVALGLAAQRSREIDPRGFYSPSLEAAKKLNQATGTVGQMKAQLLTAGAKPKELAAVGFDKAFPDPNAKVTRGEIEKYLRENRVELGTTRLGPIQNTVNRSSPYMIPEVIRAVEQSGDTPGDLLLTLENDGDAYRALTRRFPELADNPEGWAEVVANDVFGGFDRPSGASKYESYSTPGGIPGSYRENVMTLPPKDQTAAWLGRARSEAVSRSDQIMLDNQIKKLDEPVYTSSHWPGITNPLLHYRTKDFYANRPDATFSINEAAAPKTRLIDEMQSDWAQRARDKGLRDPAKAQQLQIELEQVKAEHADYDKQIEKIENDTIEMNLDPNMPFDIEKVLKYPADPRAHKLAAMRDQIMGLKAKRQDSGNRIMDLSNKVNTAMHDGVPSAPYIGSTSDWVDLGLKQALIDAAKDDSVSRLAWTPGKVQADRYNLSKHISALRYSPETGGLQYQGRNPGAPDHWSAVDSGSDGVSPERLAEYVGKDVAAKLLAAPRQPMGRGSPYEAHVLQIPEGMEIGGEGMKSFYGDMTDEGYEPGILAHRLQKLVKGLDPEAAKVEGIPINRVEETPLARKIRQNGYDPETADLQEILADNGGRLPRWLTEDDARRISEGEAVDYRTSSPYPSIPMTDAMRKKIREEGLPMFVNPAGAALPALSIAADRARESPAGGGQKKASGGIVTDHDGDGAEQQAFDARINQLRRQYEEDRDLPLSDRFKFASSKDVRDVIMPRRSLTELLSEPAEIISDAGDWRPSFHGTINPMLEAYNELRNGRGQVPPGVDTSDSEFGPNAEPSREVIRPEDLSANRVKITHPERYADERRMGIGGTVRGWFGKK